MKVLRKLSLAFIMLALSMCVIPAFAHADSGVWKHNSKGWWYEYSDGSYEQSSSQPVEIDGISYLFDSNGYMVTGWYNADGCWYYAKSSGAVVMNDWVKDGGKWYYLGEYGIMTADGWFVIADGSVEPYYENSNYTVMYDKWDDMYRFNSSGVLMTGWQAYNNQGDTYWHCYDSNGGIYKEKWLKTGGKWYYFDECADMMTGFYTPKGSPGIYYFDIDTGAWVDKPGWLSIGDDEYTYWFYLNSNATCTTGWKKIGGSWYYFSDEEYWPCMQADTVIFDGTASYVLGKTGAMLSNTWFYSSYMGGYWYYANADGTAATGWKKVDGSWYYFEPADPTWPYMYQNTTFYDATDTMYIAGKSGAMLTNAWFEQPDGGKYYATADGTTAKGWQTIGGSRYFFSDEGVLQTGWWHDTEQGVWRYYVNGEIPDDGFLTIDGDKYYFANGAIYEDKMFYVDGVYYYAKYNGVIATNSFLRHNGLKFYCASDGKISQGWFEVAGGKCYQTYSKGVYADGTYMIDGVYCKFDANGFLIGQYI